MAMLPTTRAVQALVTRIWRDETAATWPSNDTGKLMTFDVDIDLADMVDGEMEAEEHTLVDAYIFDGHIYLAVEVEGQ